MALFPQYCEVESWIHRRDPRSKLVFLLATAGVGLLAEPLPLLIMFSILIIHGLMARLPPANYKAAGLALTFTGIALVLMQWIFHGLAVGLALAGVAVLRLACLMYAFIQFVQWTHPTDMTLMGVKLGIPYRLAILPQLAVKFLPLMERELGHIYDSQYVRGERFNSAWQKAKSFLPVILPLILQSLKIGGEIALSMETKAFGYAPNRTFLRDIHFTAADLFWVSATICLSLILLLTG